MGFTKKQDLGIYRKSLYALSAVAALSLYAMEGQESEATIRSTTYNAQQASTSANASGIPSTKVQHKFGVSVSNFKVLDDKTINPNKRYVQFTNTSGQLKTYEEGIATKAKLLWNATEIGIDKYIGDDGKVHRYIYRSSPNWVSGQEILSSNSGSNSTSSQLQKASVELQKSKTVDLGALSVDGGQGSTQLSSITIQKSKTVDLSEQGIGSEKGTVAQSGSWIQGALTKGKEVTQVGQKISAKLTSTDNTSVDSSKVTGSSNNQNNQTSTQSIWLQGAIKRAEDWGNNISDSSKKSAQSLVSNTKSEALSSPEIVQSSGSTGLQGALTKGKEVTQVGQKISAKLTSTDNTSVDSSKVTGSSNNQNNQTSTQSIWLQGAIKRAEDWGNNISDSSKKSAQSLVSNTKSEALSSPEIVQSSGSTGLQGDLTKGKEVTQVGQKISAKLTSTDNTSVDSSKVTGSSNNQNNQTSTQSIWLQGAIKRAEDWGNNISDSSKKSVQSIVSNTKSETSSSSEVEQSSGNRKVASSIFMDSKKTGSLATTRDLYTIYEVEESGDVATTVPVSKVETRVITGDGKVHTVKLVTSKP